MDHSLPSQVTGSWKKSSVRAVACLCATALCLAVVLRVVDVGEVGTALRGVKPVYAAFAVVLLLCNVLISIVRFRLVLGGFGFHPAWLRLFGAFSVGSIGNQFVLNIIGQSVGRAGALTSSGVPFGATIIATFVERLLAAGVLAAAGAASAWLLLPRFGFDVTQGGAYFIFLVIGVTTAACTAIATVYRRGEVVRWVAKARRVVEQFWRAALLTVLVHLFMLGGYVSVLLALGLREPTLEIASALVIVMFIAGLPISLGGWGIRELSAVAALGAVGIESPMALAAALLVGLFSLGVNLAIAFPGLFLALRPGQKVEQDAEGANRSTRWNAGLVMGIAMLTAVAIFFQVRFQRGEGEIAVNAADFFALIGLGSLILLLAGWKERIAALPRLITWPLLGLSLLLVYGLVLGYANFGASSWALINRGLGWLIILGYVGMGLSLALVDAEQGRRFVLRLFVAAGAAVAALQIVFLILVKLGFPLPFDGFPLPLRGYANNGNAFGLQMTTTAIAAVVAHRLGVLGVGRRWLIRILFLTGLAIFFTSSRSAIGMFAMVLVMSIVFASRQERRAAIETSLVVAIGVGLAAVAIINIPVLKIPVLNITDFKFLDSDFPLMPSLKTTLAAVQEKLAAVQEMTGTGRLRLRSSAIVPGSDAQRWQTIVDGWHLWIERPIFGHGLGAYVQSQLSKSGTFVVFHSVPIWLMAEMGIIGLVVGVTAFVLLLSGAARLTRDSALRDWGVGLVMILICWGTATLVHDFTFQRVFWFFMGLAFGVWPAANRAQSPSVRSGLDTRHD